jgi:YjbE family integral membrane protein
MLPELGPEFFAALVGIILADLVLAGDNAVVIALAARNLPPEQRRTAVFFGALMAIVLRATLTIAAVFLLRGDLPGVMLVGGCALLWIGFRLAIEEEDDHKGFDKATTMRAAITTILIADVVMSIDNVLAVAAFAKDDIWLVVIGLLISIPIVMGGATILLRIIDRYPVIIWIGATLILYVGFELILNDPLTHDLLPSFMDPTWTHRLVGIVGAVVLASFAWYLRVHRPDVVEIDPSDDQSEPRLMVEGSRSDD